LWNLRLKNGDHREGMLLAEDFTKASFRSDDPADVLVGQRLLGTSLHFRGQQPEARRHLEIVLDRYVAPTSERQANLYLYDLRMITKAMLARVLLLQGFIAQAELFAQESLAISQDLKSNMSACYALRYSVCSVALLSGDLDRAEASIAMLIDLATKYNFGPFLKLGRYLEGVLLIKRGHFLVGTESLHAALDINIKDGWSLCYPEALGVLAEGYAGLGRHADAFAVIDRAFEWSDLKGERWCDAELYRIKGELLLLTGGAFPDAKRNFDRALEISKHQGALFWELKASLSYARLRMRQGRTADARTLIAPVYARFEEGFDTSYLRAARDILDISAA
jgi:tetratricopeptide (TPR) repeat protein